MKTKHTTLRQIFFTGITALFLMPARAQIVQFVPTGFTDYGPSPFPPTYADDNLTVGGFTRGTGVGTGTTPVHSAWGGSSWSGNDSGCVSFTMSANPDYTMYIDSVTFQARRDTIGPAYGSFEYSIDGGPYTIPYYLGFASPTPSGGPFTLDLTMYSDLQHVAPESVVTFRIKIDTALGGGHNGPWYILNVPTGFAGKKGFSVFGRVQPVCGMPSGLTFSAISVHDADISWDNVPGAAGYEYAISETFAEPTDWTFTTDDHVHVSGLDATTNYYVYLRVVCDSVYTSHWTGGNFMTQIQTGIDVLNATQTFSVYPNPATENITCVLPNASGTIAVTDVAGKVCKTFTVNGTQQTLDIKDLSPGVYVLRYKENTLRLLKH